MEFELRTTIGKTKIYYTALVGEGFVGRIENGTIISNEKYYINVNEIYELLRLIGIVDEEIVVDYRVQPFIEIYNGYREN